MNRFLISIAFLTLPVLAQKPDTAKQEAPKKEAVPQAPKAAAPPARVRRPVRKAPASARNYAKPHVDSRPPVVWERNWINSVRVEWEDAPVQKPPVVESKEPPNVAEELAAIRKTLEELTQLVRAMTPRQTGE